MGGEREVGVNEGTEVCGEKEAGTGGPRAGGGSCDLGFSLAH